VQHFVLTNAADADEAAARTDALNGCFPKRYDPGGASQR
jgi:hypothetical protein